MYVNICVRLYIYIHVHMCIYIYMCMISSCVVEYVSEDRAEIVWLYKGLAVWRR